MSYVTCMVPSERQAIQLTEQLRSAGFANHDISVLYPRRADADGVIRDDAATVASDETKAPEGAAIGAGVGGAGGATVGWLVGMGTLAIPGLGPFIAAGPILAALGGAAAGAAVGGVTGALVGLGVPEGEARNYESKLSQGRILVSAHCANDYEIERAVRMMQDVGAEDITYPVHA